MYIPCALKAVDASFRHFHTFETVRWKGLGFFFFSSDNRYILLIGRTPDFHFEPTIMILHIIDKLLIQMVNIYFLSWKFYCI
jgi:hypothetical protein